MAGSGEPSMPLSSSDVTPHLVGDVVGITAEDAGVDAGPTGLGGRGRPAVRFPLVTGA